MLKTLRDMAIGAIITFAAVFAAASIATVGTPPGTGFQLVDGAWLSGLAGGQNFSFQSGITAHAGGTQAACLVLPSNIYLLSVDTVASGGDSVCLPFALAGANLNIANTGAQSMNIFGQAGNNNAVSPAAPDTINGTAGSSAYALAANNNVECFAPKNGAWKCVKGN